MTPSESPSFPLPAAALPAKPGERRAWVGLRDGAAGYYAAAAAKAHPGFTLVLALDAAAAARCLDELAFYGAGGSPILHLPAWETLPYDAFSPHQDIVSERLATLQKLPNARSGALVVPVATLMQRLPPVSHLDGWAFSLRVGEHFDLHEQRSRLQAAGYVAVETVAHPGEFAVRGALLDMFPMGLDQPLRIDLLDQEIDSLRYFDVDTQRSVRRVPKVEILPAREFPFDDAGIATFRSNWHDAFSVDVRRCSLYQDVSAGIAPNGVEYYLPLFFAERALASLFDHLPENTLILQQAGLKEAVQGFWEQVQRRHLSLSGDLERPILPPETLYLPPDELHGQLKRYPRVALGEDFKQRLHFRTQPLPEVLANARLKAPAQPLLDFLATRPQARVLFTAESPGRRTLLDEFLRKAGLAPTDCADWANFLASDCRCGLAIAPIDQGLLLDAGEETSQADLLLITESQIFGHRPSQKRITGGKALDPQLVIRNLTELSIGAPVVHQEHGIGRYRGLQTLTIDGVENEYLTLEYAEAARLYVPVTSLHLIGRYAGADAEQAPLHRLGSGQWEKARRRAAEKVVDVAAELLDVLARRAARTTEPLRCGQTDYARFASGFPFDLTADQATAVDAVLEDLGSDKSTDRLICGDVGFGKTEVAMRAAFVAAQGGRQVAVLAPTTLLAQQHFDTFQDRFADWPINVDMVSRLRSAGQIRAVGERLAQGKIDILIGTHRLLGAGMDFRSLGLLIIDEEHKFGVRQKERLKTLRAEVDVITLTATPIPRTLNLALNGVRDFSLIATPPARRLSINTFVHERRNHIIREALSRELMRGGQVFYVHNQVRTINQAAEEVAKLAPQARIGIGHGQMPKRQLEQVMRDFHHRRLNVLVCSTIIENGIDIPNANTIIIDRADKFGLAQLHQLRGRVGRSHRQAYAYLMTPGAGAMTPDAKKRLTAIEAAGELGVGFALATQDLEIRGAGELLGAEQSGQIESIGLNLYMDMLDAAVRAIRAGRPPNLDAPLQTSSQEVNLHCATLIPEDYLPDVQVRLMLYKRISAAQDAAALDLLRAEIIDRFGHPPPQLGQLFRVTALKLRLAPLGITRFDLGENGGKVTFAGATPVDPAALVRLVQRQPNSYQMASDGQLRIRRKLPSAQERFAFAEQLLAALAPAGAELSGIAAG